MEIQEPNTIMPYIAGGTLLLLFFVSIFLFFFSFFKRKLTLKQNAIIFLESQHRLNLIKTQVESEEIARLKIAKDIHDELGSLLTLIKLDVGDSTPKDYNTEKIQKIENLVNMSIETTRAVCSNLVPNSLKNLGLNDALEECATLANGTNHINISFEALGIPRNLPIEAGLSVYRLFKEVLNNIIKHSKPTQIGVTVNYGESEINIFLVHNGKGIINEDLQRIRNKNVSFGLNSIESRILSLNGSINYYKDEKYFTLIKIPC